MKSCKLYNHYAYVIKDIKMTRNTSTKGEAEKLYTNKETQCNLNGNSLYDRNKKDNYWTEIKGDVNELTIGAQFHNERTFVGEKM